MGYHSKHARAKVSYPHYFKPCHFLQTLKKIINHPWRYYVFHEMCSMNLRLHMQNTSCQLEHSCTSSWPLSGHNSMCGFFTWFQDQSTNGLRTAFSHMDLSLPILVSNCGISFQFQLLSFQSWCSYLSEELKCFSRIFSYCCVGCVFGVYRALLGGPGF